VWWVPEIIGSAVHLKANEELVNQAYYALCPNMTGHNAPLAMCLSKSQSSLLDLAMRVALKENGHGHIIESFRKYPDCGDEISFDTTGYNIPCPTLSRIGEMFREYHSSFDSVDNFLQSDWQVRHQEFVSVLVKAITYIEENVALKAKFRGNPCLSNPKIDLYLNCSNVNNLRVNEGVFYDLADNEIDLRNFMEFYLDAINQDGVSVLEIADASNLPFNFVKDYTLRFADRGLISLHNVDRKAKFPRIAAVSLQLAGLIDKGADLKIKQPA
jgi:aminopeptidase-like protein